MFMFMTLNVAHSPHSHHTERHCAEKGRSVTQNPSATQQLVVICSVGVHWGKLHTTVTGKLWCVDCVELLARVLRSQLTAHS